MEQKNQAAPGSETSADKKKVCDKCGEPLVASRKYGDVCTTCDPGLLTSFCGSCGLRLLQCICAHPHTWE